MSISVVIAREFGGSPLVVKEVVEMTMKKGSLGSYPFAATAPASFVRNIPLWIAEDSSIATIAVQLGKLPTSTMRKASALRLI